MRIAAFAVPSFACLHETALQPAHRDSAMLRSAFCVRPHAAHAMDPAAAAACFEPWAAATAEEEEGPAGAEGEGAETAATEAVAAAASADRPACVG